MITAIDHVEVTVQDLDRSIDFYTNVLGFRLARRVKYEATGYAGEIVCLMLGDSMVEVLGPVQRRPDQGDPADPERIGVRMMALRVDDMAKTVEELRRKGVEVTWGPFEGGSFHGWRAEIVDPDGIAIELREWRGGPYLFQPDWEPTRPGMVKLV